MTTNTESPRIHDVAAAWPWESWRHCEPSIDDDNDNMDNEDPDDSTEMEAILQKSVNIETASLSLVELQGGTPEACCLLLELSSPPKNDALTHKDDGTSNHSCNLDSKLPFPALVGYCL